MLKNNSGSILGFEAHFVEVSALFEPFHSPLHNAQCRHGMGIVLGSDLPATMTRSELIVGNVGLGTVQYKVVTVGKKGGSHAGEITTSVWFGLAIARIFLAANAVGQPALLLFVIPKVIGKGLPGGCGAC